MFRVDLSDLRRVTDELRLAKESALPYAVRNSLNKTAFEGRRMWHGQIEADFVLRNKFTTRSVLVTKASGTSLRGMQSVLGSTAPYMRTQEFGGVVPGKSRHKPIPTSYAAGQMGASPRTKTVRRPNYLGALKAKRPTGRSRAQRNAVAIAMARRSGSKVAILETTRGKSLVRVLGRARARTRKRGGGRGKSEVRMVYDLSRGSVRVKPTPTLQDALKLMGPKMVDIHREAIIEQLKRHRLLGF